VSEPLNSDPTRRWSPPPIGPGDQTIQARVWQQQRRPLPPRASPPLPNPPTPTPRPAPYRQPPPQLQRSVYQQGLQYPPRPQPRQVPYSHHAPYQQAMHYPLQYPAVANPYRPAAPYGPQAAGGGQSKRSTTLLLAGGAVVALVIAVVLGLGMAKLMSSNGNELDVHQAEAGVKQMLTDTGYGYGIDNVAAISCNNGANPQVEKGAGFTCDVVVDGARRRVAVVFVDDQGTYEVDRPR
jgi:hypothetical protein